MKMRRIRIKNPNPEKQDIANTNFVYSDGGRASAGLKGTARDCVVRAIAIITQRAYWDVYNDLMEANKNYALTKRDRVARYLQKHGPLPCKGVFSQIYKPYLKSLGFEWVPTMRIGTGCKVHLKSEELPKGWLIAKNSRHLVAVIDGLIYDTHDPTRDGKRCVYGYFVAPNLHVQCMKEIYQ